MKKMLLLMLAVGSLVSFSCNNEGGMTSTEKKNLEVNKAITTAYEAGDWAKMSEYIATDAVDHGGETGDIKGLDNIIAEMKRYRGMVTDMKYTNVKDVADGDLVFTWATMECKMEGKPMKMSAIDVAKFKDGKAIEHWVYMDPKEMAQMMQSSMPQPSQPPMGKDTMNH